MAAFALSLWCVAACLVIFSLVNLSRRSNTTKKYGEKWRKARRLLHNLLNVNAAKSYEPYQDLESKEMLHGFLTTPDLFADHIRRYTNSLTTQMVFGFRTTAIDDPKLTQLYHGFEKWSEVVGSQTAALLDLYPILRMLPDFMLPARKHARRLFKNEKDLYVGHWMEAKEKAEAGALKPCFSVGLYEAQKAEGFSDDSAGYISGTALEGGSDTSSSTLIAFIQAMLLYPEVQRKAQAILDSYYGDRMPSLADMEDPKLQYIYGCVKESLRWMPVAIMGVPHSVTQDDHYMGYKIPKGSTIILNVW